MTSAKHAEKALLAKIPAKEMSDLELESAATMSIIIININNSEKNEEGTERLRLRIENLGCSFLSFPLITFAFVLKQALCK